MINFSPTRQELKELIKVARGEIEPDLIIKNVRLLDLINGREMVTSVAIKHKWIAGIGHYDGCSVYDAKGLTIVPGFIDAHTHIESSLMHPLEFEATTLPHGTLMTICDPHEIGNVLGEAGIAWFMRCAELMTQKMLVQIPSCVPSLPGFETNGGALTVTEMERLKESPHAFGLGEVMDFQAVINADDTILDKLDLFRGRSLDGHAPLVRGKLLNAYRAAGIQNCHESVGPEEALEKLQHGIAVMLREGSVAKNLGSLAPIVSSFNSHQCLLCTDDRNPFEIESEGHLDFMVKRLIQDHKFPPHLAYRLSSYSAAQHYNLDRVGLIAPGYLADFLLIEDLTEVEIREIFTNGKTVDLVAIKKSVLEKFQASSPPLHNSINSHTLSVEDIKTNWNKDLFHVIEVIPNEIITNHLKMPLTSSDLQTGKVNKVVVLERYHQTKTPTVGFVKGFNLQKGAFASTVAHDCHNIIATGQNDHDIVIAINHLKEIGGGFVVVLESRIIAQLPLPIAGLMSLEPSHVITKALTKLKAAISDLGCPLHEPFLQLAFLALPVIPSLKITDKGVIQADTQEFVD